VLIYTTNKGDIVPSQAFILLHGAYQGGWIWKPVAERLRAAGHTVYAPSLEGCGERHTQVRAGITVATQAQEIADFMFYEDLHDVVLVGTSAGGMVVSRAAELTPERIGRLIFVDALVLMPGERVSDIVSRSSPYETTDMVTGPTRADAEHRLFADLDPDTRAWALARYTLHPYAALEAPMELETFWQQPWKVSVIACLQATNPPKPHQRRTADKLNGTYYEIDSGHYPMLSHPEELTPLLMG
jgi:pimeloyl-ACP methyl ester carboxylesterase